MEQGELKSLLFNVRSFLEPLWYSWKEENKPWWKGNGEILSTGMCRFAVAFLQPLLEQASGEDWTIKGGMSDFHLDDYGWTKVGRPNSAWGKEDGVGGMLTTAGVWKDHYWLSNGAVLVDITADQFGWDAVLIGRADDERYLENWAKKSVIGHMDGVKLRSTNWRRDWLEQHPLALNEPLRIQLRP